jgi:type IV pilus assembly protein PilC
LRRRIFLNPKSDAGVAATEYMSDISLNSFAYTAQTFEGRPTTGTIDAADLDDASKRLADLRLRVIRLDLAQRPMRAKPLSGDDFAAFNQQLAHLSAAGLPIEQGLRLIAEDLQHGELAQSIRNVSAELERGVPLGDAFKLHEKQFPPLYGILIDAGVRTGNLPAVLLNLGRHLELVARLRAAMWRAVAYPLMVVAGLLFVLIFLGHFVLPQFVGMYREFGTALPTVTVLLFDFAQFTPIIIILAIVLIVGMPLVCFVLRATHLDRAAADLVLPLPLIGAILRRNLIARWCDAMRIAVLSGMDLSAAVKLACDVVGSPALKRDGEKILSQLSSGKFLDRLPSHPKVIPLTTLAMVQLSADRNDLPRSLENMATMYQQQAELRLESLQVVLTPLLLLLVAGLIGFAIAGLFAPLISLFRLFS